MPDPLISVVMSVRNAARSLPATLESLRRQTLKDLEIIIVDDGSTDQTWELLSHVDMPRLRLHRNTRNRGQTASLNLALEMAGGHYVARHDADDISDELRFEKQVRFLDDHPAAVLAGSQVDWVDGAGALVRHFEYPREDSEIRERLRTRNSFGHGAVMVRRVALTAVGGYRETFRLAQDYDLWLRLAEHGMLANLPDTLYTMRFSVKMASVARNSEQAAYAALARQLAGERERFGSERTDAVEAASAIVARFESMGPLRRRMELARNLVSWAERLQWWGEPSARYAWTVWTYALTAWPLSSRVWKFAARQLLKRHPLAAGPSNA